MSTVDTGTRIVKMTVRKPGRLPVDAFLVVCPCGLTHGPEGLLLARAVWRSHREECPNKATS